MMQPYFVLSVAYSKYGKTKKDFQKQRPTELGNLDFCFKV